VNSDIASPVLIYIIIPFGLGLSLFSLILKIHNNMSRKRLIRHQLELEISAQEKQIRELREKINLLSENIEIIFSRTNHTNSKLDSINGTLKTLVENSLNKNQTQYHVTPFKYTHSGDTITRQSHSDDDNLSHSQTETPNDDRQNSTVEYILKKIESKSLTTREIQQYIGRTREHTSRLMKKLYDDKFVDRDTSSKPFKYTITGEGHRLLTKYSVSKSNHHSVYQKNNENLTDGLAGSEIGYPVNSQ
jgi:predicted transcriptional regulator